jgi:hypothetical protein
MEIKILFASSKPLHPRLGKLAAGKFTIEPVPDPSARPVMSPKRYLLRFDDHFREGEVATSPNHEGDLFLSLLAVIIGSRIETEGMLVGSVPSHTYRGHGIYDCYESPVEEAPNLDGALGDLCHLEPELARQFIRACEVYRTALSLIGENNTLAYFLLTIAVECLANKTIGGEGTCDNFIAFILRCLPNKGDFPSEEDWREILKEVYYRHRSGFTHGGKRIPEAVWLADKLDRSYVRNEIDGKQVRTPGLKWFERIVRDCLHAFLANHEHRAAEPRDLLKELSLEDGMVKMRAKRAIRAGEPVGSDDLDLD